MGPWHDWVMVKFTMNGNHVISQLMRERHCEKYCFQPDEYPCKILASWDVVAMLKLLLLCNLVRRIIMKMIPFVSEMGKGDWACCWRQDTTIVAYGSCQCIWWMCTGNWRWSLKRESEVRKENQPGCTLVLPWQEWLAKSFMLSG